MIGCFPPMFIGCNSMFPDIKQELIESDIITHRSRKMLKWYHDQEFDSWTADDFKMRIKDLENLKCEVNRLYISPEIRRIIRHAIDIEIENLERIATDIYNLKLY